MQLKDRVAVVTGGRAASGARCAGASPPRARSGVVVADRDAAGAEAVAREIGGLAVADRRRARPTSSGWSRARTPPTGRSTCSARMPASRSAPVSATARAALRSGRGLAAQLGRAPDVPRLCRARGAAGHARARQRLPAEHRVGGGSADRRQRACLLGHQARRRGVRRVARDRLRRARIRVSCLCPQGVRTAMLDGVASTSPAGSTCSPA